MAAIRIFIVFHQALDERWIFPGLARTEVDRYFVKYAVNAGTPNKWVVRLDGAADASLVGPDVYLEYALPRYRSELQARGFMETSCYVHVESNELHRGADFVGVTQYDMVWTRAAMDKLRDLERRSSDESRAYALISGTLVSPAGAFHPLAFAERCNWRFLLESYNRFFGKTWGPEVLIGKPLTLYQTYILPRREFSDLARWLTRLCDEVFPWAAQPPYETHWGVLGGYTERAASLFIAARLHEGRIDLHELPLEHNFSIGEALRVNKPHYGETP